MSLSHRVPACRADVPARYAHCQEVLRIARRCALRLGLAPDAAEDCALAFVGRVLLDDTEKELRPPEMRHLTGAYSAPWVWRCALNHAFNFRRYLQHRKDQEEAWPDTETADGRGLADSAPGPADLLMNRWLAEEFRDCVMRLEPVPREVLLRHHIGLESIQTIAGDLGRTPHAVEQCLLRTRHRLRVFLERHGVSAEDVVIHAAPAPGGHCARPKRRASHAAPNTPTGLPTHRPSAAPSGMA